MNPGIAWNVAEQFFLPTPHLVKKKTYWLVVQTLKQRLCSGKIEKMIVMLPQKIVVTLNKLLHPNIITMRKYIALKYLTKINYNPYSV